MANEKDLINWKTHAWDDPSTVAWYAGRMVENTGTDPLKRHLEANLIERWAGDARDILDVGCGTGRGSLPFVRRGRNVTGIDSSQAMLDETRRQAGEAPVTLIQGDVTNLPLPDAAFDFLLSLNVVVHFPNWKEIMDEFHRVLRPGGRMLFDIHSRDHYMAALPPSEAASFVARGTSSASFNEFMAMAMVDDIIDWADKTDWTIEAIVPVGAFLGGGALNQWLRAFETRFDWRRLMSWLAKDRAMQEFGLFIEEEIVSRLPPAATCRFFVVGRKGEGKEANDRLRREIAAKNACFQPGGDAAALAAWLPFRNKDFQEELRWHLRSPRNRQVLYRLLSAVRARLPHLAWTDLLPEPISQLFEDWETQDGIDNATLDFIRSWQQASEAGKVLTCHGVPMATGLEYGLMESVLTRFYGVFSGTRS